MTGDYLAVASSALYYRFRKLAQNDFGHTIAYKVRNRIGCYSLIEETYFFLDESSCQGLRLSATMPRADFSAFVVTTLS